MDMDACGARSRLRSYFRRMLLHWRLAQGVGNRRFTMVSSCLGECNSALSNYVRMNVSRLALRVSLLTPRRYFIESIFSRVLSGLRVSHNARLSFGRLLPRCASSAAGACYRV